MMTASPAFARAAFCSWGDPASVGIRTGNPSFTASSSGAYPYLCPVPSHAQKGMIGTDVVS